MYVQILMLIFSMSSLNYIFVKVVDIVQPANAQIWAPCSAHTFTYKYMYTQCVYSLTPCAVCTAR